MPTPSDKNVDWLEVAMHNPLTVSGIQGVGDLPRQFQQLSGFQWFRGDPFAQGLTFERRIRSVESNHGCGFRALVSIPGAEMLHNVTRVQNWCVTSCLDRSECIGRSPMVSACSGLLTLRYRLPGTGLRSSTFVLIPFRWCSTPQPGRTTRHPHGRSKVGRDLATFVLPGSKRLITACAAKPKR